MDSNPQPNDQVSFFVNHSSTSMVHCFTKTYCHLSVTVVVRSMFTSMSGAAVGRDNNYSVRHLPMIMLPQKNEKAGALKNQLFYAGLSYRSNPPKIIFFCVSRSKQEKMLQTFYLGVERA